MVPSGEGTGPVSNHSTCRHLLLLLHFHAGPPPFSTWSLILPLDSYLFHSIFPKSRLVSPPPWCVFQEMPGFSVNRPSIVPFWSFDWFPLSMAPGSLRPRCSWEGVCPSSPHASLVVASSPLLPTFQNLSKSLNLWLPVSHPVCHHGSSPRSLLQGLLERRASLRPRDVSEAFIVLLLIHLWRYI